MRPPFFLPTPLPARCLSRYYSRHHTGPTWSQGWLLAALLLASGTSAAQAPQLDLPRTQLRAGMHLIQAQVAATPEQRSTGLMWRQAMPQHEGMLFVFERPAVQCFWMKNTLLPLTAAFVADDGRIVNLADMQPRSEISHCSKEPVRFVLEMNQGWFAGRHLGAGYRLQGGPFQAR
ncbi:DUF192 domain-containing protein [Macromonas bipunctata]|uniref:DUF192 domain-containing protein n=1 Tax=Macromonas bipunctata TaxID=183670 RepID=UPI000C34525F|nr:DUF192 domain-containing protein [Macromonas bipunctata]